MAARAAVEKEDSCSGSGEEGVNDATKTLAAGGAGGRGRCLTPTSEGFSIPVWWSYSTLTYSLLHSWLHCIRAALQGGIQEPTGSSTITSTELPNGRFVSQAIRPWVVVPAPKLHLQLRIRLRTRQQK